MRLPLCGLEPSVVGRWLVSSRWLSDRFRPSRGLFGNESAQMDHGPLVGDDLSSTAVALDQRTSPATEIVPGGAADKELTVARAARNPDRVERHDPPAFAWPRATGQIRD